MYVRSDDDSDKRTHNPRTGEGAGVRKILVLTVAVAPPAMTNKSQHRDRKVGRFAVAHGFHAPGDETPEKADHGGISGKVY